MHHSWSGIHGGCIAYLRSEIGTLQGEVLALRLKLAAWPEPKEPTVQIAGVYMDRSLWAFERACKVYLEMEQQKLAPDNALIAILCDSVRLARELVQMAKMPIVQPEPQTEAAIADAATWPGESASQGIRVTPPQHRGA